MKKALFIVPPLLGHLRATLRMSEILSLNGYHITYFGTANVKDFILSHGYDFFISSSIPFGINLDTDIAKSQGIKIRYLTTLKNKLESQIYEVRKSDILRALDLVKPNIVFIDAYLSTDFIIFYNVAVRDKIKLFFLQTMLSCNDYHNVPYIDSKLAPNKTVRILFERITRIVKAKIDNSVNKIIYLGHDDKSVVNSKLKQEGVAKCYYPTNDNYLFFSFDRIPELITAPIELEFQQIKKANQHYLGLFTSNQSNLLGDFKEIDLVVKKSKTEEKRIIYISFGSLFVNRLDSVINFLKKADLAFNSIPNVIGILSLGGNDVDLATVNFINIYVFNFVPQTSLLNCCNVFITHGGLNSIKESIVSETPMLVYPLEIDQLGNAQKIQSKGIGICGDLEGESVDELRIKVNKVLTDNTYKNSISELKRSVINKYNESKIILDLIERTDYIK